MAEVGRCDGCGSALPRGRAGPWCSSWCEARAAQGLPPQSPPPVVLPVHELRGRAVSVEVAVQRALEGAGLLEEWSAAQALDMARWIDQGTSKGSALAALHRELGAVMSDLMRGVDEPGSRVGVMRDELAARRARRTGGT